MISNERLRPYLFPFLAFCVLSSKNIIIYNEELLVSVTFFAFVVFVFNYLGSTVKESLDERSKGIKQELQQFFLLKKESLNQVSKEYEKVFLLKKGLTSLDDFTRSQVKRAGKRGVETLYSLLSHQIEQKLATLSLSNAPLQPLWQQRMADYQLPFLLVTLSQRVKNDQKSASWDSKIAQTALQLLGQLYQTPKKGEGLGELRSPSKV